MKVTNLLGHKNQYIVEDDYGNLSFQSYDTCMAVVRNSFEEGYERELEVKSHLWSATTGKHFMEFLKETHMVNALDTLIDNKVFRNVKDFMLRAELLQVRDDRICVVYTNRKGELTSDKFDLTYEYD